MHLYTPHMFLVILLFCLATAAFPCSAAPADDGTVVYSTDFTNGDGWITNSKERFYPEVETGRYHYLLEGGTGGYSAYALPQKVNGQFILEFDVTPEKTDDDSSFRFGIGTDKKDSQRGPLLMVELANKKDGRLFYLKTVSKENSLNLVGSSPSTGSSGSTVRFEDNTTYHVKLTYYAADSRASIVVQQQGSPDVIFTASAPVSGKIEDLTHLYLTAIGDGISGPQAEGYIDNIKLTLFPTPAEDDENDAKNKVDETPVPVITPAIITPTDEPTLIFTPGPTRTPFPLPPTPTPTQTPKSGLGFLVLLPALAGGAILAMRKNR